MLDRFKANKMLAILVGWCVTSTVMAAADYWQMNMPKGVTPISHEMYDLHMIAIVICAIIGIIVFGIMIYSLIHHRKSKGYVPAQFHDNFRLELAWSIIPFLILIALAVPATNVLIRMEDTSESDVTIKVTGYQWRWQYQYMDQGISFFSNLSTPYDQIHNKQKKGQWYLLEVDNPLVLPVNKKVRFLVTSKDVIHSWWVPDLGVKRDAMPGFMHESWTIIEKPGVYRGQCAELCGINHGFMPIVVKAVSDEEFKKWVDQQPKVADIYEESTNGSSAHSILSRDELMSAGKAKYEQMCLACHKADGEGMPPMYPPLKGSSIAVGNPISRHIELILNGVAGSSMQAFKDQLSDVEIAAIVTYERNAWGNNTNDLVQPEDVAKVRASNLQRPKVIKKAQAGGFQ